MKRTKYYRPANRDYMIRKTNLTSEIAMIVIAAAILFSACQARACDGVYLKVGTSYKTHSEAYTHVDGVDYQWKDHSSPIGARFELGAQKGRFTAGVAHYSQWGNGWPVNNNAESARTEVFIDVKFDLWGL